MDGAPETIEALVDSAELPESAEVLGPVPLGEVGEDGAADRERLIVRVDRTESRELAGALRAAQAQRAARKAAELQVRLDPLELL